MSPFAAERSSHEIKTASTAIITSSSAIAVSVPKWIAEGRPLEDGVPIMRDRHFTARRDAGLVRDVTQVQR